ncbi:hypothetical protein HBN50_00360 [Halobacteriovorax sp. GB3]|uniref:hypothetical protein n=1 Tax=Halobacteriovorax sp. GB3 TaxID=2719615 RepID=UPI0023609F6B|nr:hypothetical protein [Halobacteriovorax sp. GB3]MDD0851518.1 hypothetical protein [Halobacteriovorax sp. GB3]
MKALLTLAFILSFNSMASLIPKNDLRIPSTEKSQALDEGTFNKIIDQIEAIYGPHILKHEGYPLIVKRLWDNDRVNAYSKKNTDQNKKIVSYEIGAFGGLARYQHTTEDSFKLVLCHEIGHLIGGAPTWKPFSQASSEGQADYFSTMKCFKRLEKHSNNKAIIEGFDIPSLGKDKCKAVYKNKADYFLCLRQIKAIEEISYTFADLSGLSTRPQLDTPDPYVRMFILFNDYPNPQCRVDTLFAGTLCNVANDDHLSLKLYNLGMCTDYSGHEYGLRPKCWYVEREEDKK